MTNDTNPSDEEQERESGEKEKSSSPSPLSGTTLRVYRYLYKSGKPLNIHEVQRGLNLSSPSVSQYHLRKLVQVGLVREEKEDGGDNSVGFIVDKIVFENMFRIRKSVIPVQVTYAIFFATLLAVLLTILRPADIRAPLFLFGVVATVSGLGLFLLEALKSLRALD